MSAVELMRAKKGFSTMRRTTDRTYRHKTEKEKIRSEMKYNRFVRDTINEYMGIFPLEKLQSEFGWRKPNFVNPQSLKFKDGSDFLTEGEMAHILEFLNNPVKAQEEYNNFVRENEITKSLDVDIEKTVLKNLENNLSDSLHFQSDVGIVKEEY
jgi:hypothetical protein